MYSFQLQASNMSPVLLFFVTTSPKWKWVIYAPAAFLRFGSRFSECISVCQEEDTRKWNLYWMIMELLKVNSHDQTLHT
ncbi:hypothetical protein FF38_04563 [Lucilia cuprina]|uniref:Uncharacterized protein n=1 Tax=Lucilia cuprina TaxID=7375 RepID=A0A0L0BWB9_LUCCU|nr:hypothetical protein FF38_04563 [Lucilia cuprina]